MSQELIGILLVGVGLATVILLGQSGVKRDISNLVRRIARLEGLFEGYTQRERPFAAAAYQAPSTKDPGS